MKMDDSARKIIEQDARYSDIGNLPSNFFPYPFKRLMIRPFTVKELKLVSKAAVLEEPVHMLRAVDLVIDQDVGTITIGDFYYILMWLKINSAPKTPYVVEWHCPESQFKNKETGDYMFNDDTFAPPVPSDKDKWEVVKCETHNTELIHLTNVEILQLPEKDWPGLGDDKFDFPRMSKWIEIKEALKDPEQAMIVPAAQWIKSILLADSMKLLEEEPTADLMMTAMVLNKTVVHGISETAKLHCRGCKAEHDFNINLEPSSFFQ